MASTTVAASATATTAATVAATTATVTTTTSAAMIFNLPTGVSPYSSSVTPTGVTGPSSTDSKSNLPMIVGAAVGGVVVLAMLGLLVQRFRSRSRASTTNSHQSRSRPTNNQTAAAGSGNEEDRGDRAKLAKSFTIRQPPSHYVEDDQDLNQSGHPNYKSASDAFSHPYYGDRMPAVVEYELTDTNGQKYGPSNVMERKRYVEQQQRKVMDEYEMFNPYNDAPPQSPYPASQAPSYTSGPLSPTSPTPLSPTMTPSMGGRSPRVQHPSQSPLPYGRPKQQDSNDYMY